MYVCTCVLGQGGLSSRPPFRPTSTLGQAFLPHSGVPTEVSRRIPCPEFPGWQPLPILQVLRSRAPCLLPFSRGPHSFHTVFMWVPSSPPDPQLHHLLPSSPSELLLPSPTGHVSPSASKPSTAVPCPPWYLEMHLPASLLPHIPVSHCPRARCFQNLLLCSHPPPKPPSLWGLSNHQVLP